MSVAVYLMIFSAINHKLLLLSIPISAIAMRAASETDAVPST